MQEVLLGRLPVADTQYTALVAAGFATVHHIGVAVQQEEQDTQMHLHTEEGECKGVVHIEPAAQMAAEVGDRKVGTAAETVVAVVGNKQVGVAVADT